MSSDFNRGGSTQDRQPARTGRNWGQALWAAILLGVALGYTLLHPGALTGWHLIAVLLMVIGAVGLLIKVAVNRRPKETR